LLTFDYFVWQKNPSIMKRQVKSGQNAGAQVEVKEKKE